MGSTRGACSTPGAAGHVMSHASHMIAHDPYSVAIGPSTSQAIATTKARSDRDRGRIATMYNTSGHAGLRSSSQRAESRGHRDGAQDKPAHHVLGKALDLALRGRVYPPVMVSGEGITPRRSMAVRAASLGPALGGVAFPPAIV